MKKKIMGIILCLFMLVGLLPAQSYAQSPEPRATGQYEVTIQAVIRDSEGKWVSTNALPSKNFSGTTVAGSSGGGSEGQWQWTPEGGGYILTAELNSHANAWGGLKYPTALWEYDSDELEFVGIGRNSYATEVSYPDDVDSSFLFERNSYLLANGEGGGWYRTYIFEQIDTTPETDWGNLEIEKTADKTTADQGEEVTYTIKVTNNTGKALTNITVSEELDENLTLVSASGDGTYADGVWTIPSLAAGAEAKLTITAEVNSDAAAGTVINNTATVTDATDEDGGKQPEGNDPEDGTEITVTEPENPTDWENLTIEKTADKTTADPGEEVTYTIKVTNNTGKDLTNITVSEELDENLTLVSAEGDGTYADGVWTIPSLAAGAEAKLTITAEVNSDAAAGTVINNTATVTDATDEDGGKQPEGNDPEDGTEITVTEPEIPVDPENPTDWGKLTIEKTADKTAADPGEEVTYTIKVTNNTGKDLTNITVSEELDENLVLVSADGDGTYADGVWTIPVLENGESAVLIVKAAVSTEAEAGSIIRNVATIIGATDDENENMPEENRPDGTEDITVTEPEDPQGDPQKDPDAEDLTKPDNNKTQPQQTGADNTDKAPQTGDNGNIFFWTAAVLVSLVCFMQIAFYLRKKK